MKYVVMIQLDEDGENVCEYTGTEYTDRNEARAEFFKAKEDAQVFCAWIDARMIATSQTPTPDWYESDPEREAYGISGWSADPWDDLDRDLNDRYYLIFE